MSLISRARRQKAVYWAQGTQKPSAYGAPVVSPGVEIACRWEDTQEKFITFDGEDAVSKCVVMVDREMKTGDLLRLGALSTVADPNNARANKGVFEVRGFDKIPNIRATENLYIAYL